MKEIALHILDIAQNSISAKATLVELTLSETPEAITFTIVDNGRGMSPELLAQVSDPFTTTRTTRKMGLGIPLLRMAVEQTGGSLTIDSTEGVGTTVTAQFRPAHIDCPPVRWVIWPAPSRSCSRGRPSWSCTTSIPLTTTVSS